MIATGRSWEGTRGILRVLEIAPEFVVCSNGAVVLRRLDADDLRYERFHVETFDPTEVLTLLREHLPDARYLVELPDGHRLYTEYLEDWNLAHAERVAFEELAAQPVCRIVVVAPEQGEQDFVDLVARIGLNQVSYAVGWTAWLDIAPQGVDKSTGLELVRTELGMRPRARARDRRRPQRRRHVPLGARERRPRGRDGAGSARGAGCRGRDDHVGRGRRRRRGAAQAVARGIRYARDARTFRGLPGAAGRMGGSACRLDSTPVRRMPRSVVFGRVVRAADGPGLENQWAAMSRGFESHTLRRCGHLEGV